MTKPKRKVKKSTAPQEPSNTIAGDQNCGAQQCETRPVFFNKLCEREKDSAAVELTKQLERSQSSINGLRYERDYHQSEFNRNQLQLAKQLLEHEKLETALAKATAVPAGD